MNIKKLIPLTLFLFLISSCENQHQSPLRLTMKSDRQKYRVGDEIKLHCKLHNISDETLNFYPDNQTNVAVRNMDGDLCIPELLQTGEWPTQMITLRPDEVNEYTLEGKTSRRSGGISDAHQQGVITDSAKGEYRMVTGIFIEFPYNNYYLKKGFGKYKITSYFTDGNKLSDEYTSLPPEERDSFLKDKWQGALASNTVTIEITK